MKPHALNWAMIALLITTAACADGTEAGDAPWSEAQVRQELDQFMATYFAALENGDPIAVADSYHPEGASIGNRGALATFDRAQMIERYQWLHESPPGDLWWIEVEHHVLGPDAVLATGVIGWLYPQNVTDTLLISYTGLVVRSDDGWRIRHEHESTDQMP